jgi:hypothetical protein
MTAIVDTSVFCGYWPFRCLSHRTPEELKKHLTGHGVRRAWVAASEAILYPDPMLANEPLFAAIKGDGFFVPVAVIDVTLGTWRRDLGSCLEDWGCRAVKLVPNYHCYALADPRIAELVSLAHAAGVPVCVQMRMMDERAHHPLMIVQGVPAADVAALANAHPDARFLACGAYRTNLKELSAAANVWAETSLVESSLSLRTAVEAMGPARVVFGSHSPFQYFEAMAAKLDVDAEDVPLEQVRAICEGNAAALLGRR